MSIYLFLFIFTHKMMMQRIILHLDLDYFFAQVEEKRNQKYKDKPIVVCIYSGRSEDSGAVSTSNYKAREYGVKAGLPIAFAKKRLEGGESLFIAADHDHYKQLSEQIMSVLQSFADVLEQASIDEAYLEITKKIHGDWNKAKELAEQMSNQIYSIFDLTCSIGVGPNKLIAKMASSFKKPNGVTIVKPEQVHDFIDNQPIENIPGVGKKTAELLEQHDVVKISDLNHKSPVWLIEEFGKGTGQFLINSSEGKDDSPVSPKEEVKQLSRIKTLKSNTLSLEEIQKESQDLIDDLSQKIQEDGLNFSTIGIIAIDENLKTSTRSKTLSHPANDKEILVKTVNALWEEFLEKQTSEIRRIGVKIEKLQLMNGQRNLMEL